MFTQARPGPRRGQPPFRGGRRPPMPQRPPTERRPQSFADYFAPTSSFLEFDDDIGDFLGKKKKGGFRAIIKKVGKAVKSVAAPIIAEKTGIDISSEKGAATRTAAPVSYKEKGFLESMPDWQKYAAVGAIALIGVFAYTQIRKRTE